jgi:hypothetical protein
MFCTAEKDIMKHKMKQPKVAELVFGTMDYADLLISLAGRNSGNLDLGFGYTFFVWILD